MLKTKVKEQDFCEMKKKEARLKSLFAEHLGAENSVRYKDGKAIWRGCMFDVEKGYGEEFLRLVSTPIPNYPDEWRPLVIIGSKDLLSVAETVEEYLESKLKEKPSIFQRIFNKITKK